MNIILFGFKRCGKTYFGKLLAQRLGRPFIDTDQIIEQLDGENRSCRQIAQQLGENAFREREKEAIASLQGTEGSIISIGGGAILDRINAQSLERLGKLVYLRIDKKTVKERLLSGELPSYLDPLDPEGSFEKMYLARKAIYEKIPSLQIDMEGKSEQEVLELIIQGVKNGQ